MATFQKIMSSSPRAIRQALRRRLLVLLARKQLELEVRRRSTQAPAKAAVWAEEILRIQDEMLAVAKAILGEGSATNSDAEAYVGRIRRRLQKREEQLEVTEWSLDGDEEGEEGVFAESNIPDEIPKVRDLIANVPDGPDRRFETLVRAISDLTRDNTTERVCDLHAIPGYARVSRRRTGPYLRTIATSRRLRAGRWRIRSRRWRRSGRKTARAS